MVRPPILQRVVTLDVTANRCLRRFHLHPWDWPDQINRLQSLKTSLDGGDDFELAALASLVQGFLAAGGVRKKESVSTRRTPRVFQRVTKGAGLAPQAVGVSKKFTEPPARTQLPPNETYKPGIGANAGDGFRRLGIRVQSGFSPATMRSRSERSRWMERAAAPASAKSLRTAGAWPSPTSTAKRPPGTRTFRISGARRR